MSRKLLLLLSLSLVLGFHPVEMTEKDPSNLEILEDTYAVPPHLSLRARVVSINPESPTDLEWRWGGEGTGGKVQRGTLAKNLEIGEWSPIVSVSSLVGSESTGPRTFLTFTCGQHGKRIPNSDRFTGYSTDVMLEFQFYDGQILLKTFEESGQNGGTVGIVIPFFLLAGGKELTDPDFLFELDGLNAYSRIRLRRLEALPWAGRPVPQKYAIITALGGYGEGMGYGLRTTNPQTMKQELQTLLQLGVNGVRDPSEPLSEVVRSDYADQFHLIRLVNTMGFPVPSIKNAQKLYEAGCPFGPGVAARTSQDVARAVHDAVSIDAEQVWARTVDEIGLVIDHSAEGKKHPSVCPNCAAAFRSYLKMNRLRPQDFSQRGWDRIKPVDVSTPVKIHTRAEGLLSYYSTTFNNYATAQLFTPLKNAFRQTNDAKRAALADPKTADSAVAKQPWIYSFALRGNTFLLGGHSLDFFDFYRYSDNAFVYETSNRDARIWSWDSYLCDVARMVSKERNIEFGIYVKPHRGAPVQRALSAISRGAKMIYWYTYGPDWSNGDSFAGEPETLEQVSKASRLIASAEDVLYGSKWVEPPRIAVIRPLSSEIWFRLSGRTAERVAAWENGKWIYTALAHAHLPVDALDEGILDEVDLSNYDVIYLSGPNLKTAAAEKIRDWVRNGGILYTSGWGLVSDEADQPLKILQPVLGLKTRSHPILWSTVRPYAGNGLEPFGHPQDEVTAIQKQSPSEKNPFQGHLSLTVGRETLDPQSNTEVLARFKDGKASITRNVFGKGSAYTVGFFAGLEYSTAIRRNAFNMGADFDESVRNFIVGPAQEIVKPTVQADEPTVEGQLIENVSSGRRAVVLMNWTYRAIGLKRTERSETNPLLQFGKSLLLSIISGEENPIPIAELVPYENLTIQVRPGGPVTRIRSAMLDREIPFTLAGDEISIQLPRLEEADVLLLE